MTKRKLKKGGNKASDEEVIKKKLRSYFVNDDYADPSKVGRLLKKCKEGKVSEKEIYTTLNAHHQFDLETGQGFLMAVPEPYEPMMLRFRNRTVEEYGCKTHLELALVDTIAMGYMRVLQQGWLLRMITESGEISDHQVEVMKIASKELDRANRNFLSATQTLLQMKSKPINIQIKNAYMAQNQLNQNKS